MTVRVPLLTHQGVFKRGLQSAWRQLEISFDGVHERVAHFFALVD